MADNMDYQKQTDELRGLLAKIDKTGESAWVAGEKLYAIKSQKIYLEKHRNFELYCKDEFGASSTTVDLYLRIYKNFEKSEVQGFLITHLGTIAHLIEVRNKRSEFLKALSLVKVKLKNDEIAGLATLVNSSDVNNLVPIITSEIKEIENKRRVKESGQKSRIRYAELDRNPILQISPIDVYGVIALFCLKFNELNAPITLDYEKLYFKSFREINKSFPNAIIDCAGNSTIPRSIHVQFFI